MIGQNFQVIIFCLLALNSRVCYWIITLIINFFLTLSKFGAKCANVFFAQIIQHFFPFPKLIKKIPFFCNSIFGQSSYNKLKIKKKKITGTWAPWTRIPCNFLKPYSDVLKPYSGILKHASFFLKSDCSIGRPIVAF